MEHDQANPPSQAEIARMNQRVLEQNEAYKRQQMTFGERITTDIEQRDAKLLKLRKLARELVRKNGIDPVACRERDIGLDILEILAGVA